MVRSKFPGKPSKFTNRKLVNVSNCTSVSVQENESARAAEFICYGLSVFNETFGRDDDEAAPFHGFSPYDIARSRELAHARIAEIEKEHKNRGVAFIPLNEKVRSKSLLLPESFVKNGNSDPNEQLNRPTKLSDSSKNQTIKVSDSDAIKKSLKLTSDNGSSDCVSIISSDVSFPSRGKLKSLFNDANSSVFSVSNCSSSSSSSNNNSRSGSSCISRPNKNVVGASNNSAYKKNFILPCRSARSARVIKPNKRFLDKDCNNSNRSVSGESSSSSVTGAFDCSEQITNGLVSDRPSTSATSTSTSSGIQLKKARLVLGPGIDDPNFTWARSRDDSSTIISDVESDDTSSLKTVCSMSSSSTNSSEQPNIVTRRRKTRKVILRKPRLNIVMPPLPEPTRQKINAVRGKVVCGVCSAVRYYSFVRQARKFGIYSCESCRKFISRMIRNANGPLHFNLHCKEGKGLCTVPVIKTVVWEAKKHMISKLTNLRCRACWLKMCLKCYSMPEILKIKLNNMLPMYMRNPKIPSSPKKKENKSVDNLDAVDCSVRRKSSRNIGRIRLEDRLRQKRLENKGLKKRRKSCNSLSNTNIGKNSVRRQSTIKQEENDSDSEASSSKAKGSVDGNEDCGVFKRGTKKRNSDTSLEMVDIIKNNSSSSGANTSRKMVTSGNKCIKGEKNLQTINCKSNSVARDRGDSAALTYPTISSNLKSDKKHLKLESSKVPLVVPEKRKRGRKKKVSASVVPVAVASSQVVKVEEETRQKRKAALNSLANIARVTGRITESAVENQLIVARNLKKKATAIARREPILPFQRKKENTEQKTGVKRKRRGKISLANISECRLGVGSVNRSSSSVSIQGPRVKHVCRSASLVLGRQVATFNQSPVKMKTQLKDSCLAEDDKSSLVPLDTSSSFLHTPVTPAFEQKSCNLVKSDDIYSSALPPLLPLTQTTTPSSLLSQPLSALPPSSGSHGGGGVSGRIRQPSLDVVNYKEKNDKEDGLSNNKGKPKIYARTLQDLGRQNCELLDGVTGRSKDVSVSIDFWESYDPEEICKTGFALIGSDPSFRVPSLCFLCGSAGSDKLVHCACCCEPYHLYCLEGGIKDLKQSQWWRVDWVCPRCAICNACGKGDGTHVSCNKCRKSYHIDCLPHDRISNRAHSSERPWVCHSCLRCKSCNAKSVSKFVGNIPLCNSCFKLRQKGSFCRLCQKCYDDNDFDTKMMECGRCNSWVHAKCEGLSNEKYQVLSFLPDSVEFICRLCCDTPPAAWWLAVEAELKAGFFNVLKSLTKNRKACELLKWSPGKQSLPVCLCNSWSSSSRNRGLPSRSSLPQLDLSESFVQDQPDPLSNSSSLTKDSLLMRRKSDNPNNDCLVSSVSASSSTNKLNTMKEDECLKTNSQTVPSSLSILNVLNETMKPNDCNLVKDNSTNCAKDNESINGIKVNSNDNDGDKCEIKSKFNVKDCSVSLKNCLASSGGLGFAPASEELQVKVNDADPQFLSIPSYQCLESSKGAQFSPHATSQSDSGIGSTDDELKPSSSVDDGEMMISSTSTVTNESVTSTKQCYCFGFESLSKTSPSLLYIKNKVNANGYSSLEEFHQDMQSVVKSVQSTKLLDVYYQILLDAFPWFDPKCSQVFDSQNTDANSIMIFNKNKADFDKKDDEIKNNESLGYYEDTSVVLKDLLGLKQSYYYLNINFKDTRVCVLCKSVGDGHSEDEGRLLYCGHNEWIHANCALWSNEVFEEIDGSLQRVHSAISRSRLIRCAFCGKRGASVGCCYRNCPESYHFHCAKIGNCVFMEDKSIYCNLHQNVSKSKPLRNGSDFAITRPIYVELVELERKRKKFVPHHQVRVMVGSLSVESLGEFVADVSDQELSIIPCEFVCTRWYWSSIEPWRLVRYHIKTKILQSSHEYSVENDDNFTVDHSLDDKEDQPSDQLNSYGHESSTSDQNCEPVKKIWIDESILSEVKFVVDNVLDTICINLGKEEDKAEETLGALTDAQTSADLLPPEIKEAIFEDLPHDILDGISMQDIFPKFMNFDDVVDKNDKLEAQSDFDVSNSINSCNLKSKKLKMSSHEVCNFPGNSVKKLDDLNSKCLIENSKGNSNQTLSCDSLKPPSKIFLKNNNSLLTDVQQKPKAVVKPDISNKSMKKFDLDSNSTDTEKIKLFPDWKNSAILQVDGATDYSNSDSSIGSPCYADHSNSSVLFVTIKDTKQNNVPNKLKHKDDLNLCRVLQVDGCIDSGSEYESSLLDSPKHNHDYDSDSCNVDYDDKISWQSIAQLDGTSDCNNIIEMNNKDTNDEPVKCMQCHRTYRTAISFERHLTTCNSDYILSCSESDSSEEEKMSSPVNGFSPSSVSNNELANNNSESTESGNNIESGSSTVSVDSSIIAESASNVEVNEVATSLVEPNSDFCQGAEDVVEYVVQTSESMDGVQESTCINSALYKDADSPIVNPDNNNFTIITTSDDQNEIEIPSGDVTVLYAPDNVDNCILINIDNDSKIVEDNSLSTTYYITDSTTSNCSSVVENNVLKNVQVIESRNKKMINYSQTASAIAAPQPIQQQQQIVDYQNTPALIIQQVPAQQNVVPTYVDTFSQSAATVQPQQNIHYITIDSTDKNTPQFPSAVLSNAYQIQPTSPAVQTVVPTVVGTLIQPNGVEQLVLNTNPTNSIDVFGHQNTGGGVYLSSPSHMYMNMETVVSNTVMSSSQFVSVPGSVPGMLSTYSATTTQVFQAAKPIIDIPAQSYLVINTSPNATAATPLVSNTVHQVNTVPQTNATATINPLQQTKQEPSQWPTYQYHQNQIPVEESYKVNEKRTVARLDTHKKKNFNCVQRFKPSAESVTLSEPPVRITNYNKIVASQHKDVLKIRQNAQKIGPVHQLSKMVDNIHTATTSSSSSSNFTHTSTKKICLNSLPTKQKPPEAKVMPQPKVTASLQKLDSLTDKFNKKLLSNSFSFTKKLSSVSYNNKQLIDDVSINSVTKEDFVTNKSLNCSEKSSPKKSCNAINVEIKPSDLPPKLLAQSPPKLVVVNKESEDKFDKLISSEPREVKVEQVTPVVNDSTDSNNTVVSDNKVRTYLNSKKRVTPVMPSALSAEMKQQFKSQLMKELNKNNQKYVNNHSLGDTSGNCNSTNNVGSNRVLQPTLKENKILDRLKLISNEKVVTENNIKRGKIVDKKTSNESATSSSRKERSEKIVNCKQKQEKLKRKECSSSITDEKVKRLNNNNNNSNLSSKKSNVSPNMIFEINSDDGFSCSTPNLVDAWQKVFEAVQAARASKKLPPLPRNPYQSVNSLMKMLGLGNNSLKYMIEQLPGVSNSVKYKPTYHKNRHNFVCRESETKENSSGCARTESYLSRNKCDMFSWLASRHRRPPKLLVSSDADIINGNRRATSLNLPMAMRFRHLRETSKEAVGVFRSDIHGRGLFCLRDIDSGEMVIEYAGEVIRSALTDKREKYYTSKGIGCYMFRIDDNFVVDATMKGNAARFINHSCEPNCYSRVVDILGKKHILIFALRRIPQGEELTYDYKFPLEDDKITCHCLSRKCRKYLN